jgi:hypothetical protein
MDGVDIIGTFDDDAHMVGPSTGWPWTFYVLADVRDQPTVKDACNLLRTVRWSRTTPCGATSPSRPAWAGN